MKNIALLISFFSIAASSLAQNIIPLGSTDDAKYFLAPPQEYARIGNGVLIWIIDDTNSVAFAERYFISCDGKFSSGGFNFQVSAKDSLDQRMSELRENFTNSRGQLLTRSIDFLEFEENSMPHKNRIKSNLKSICASARPERKGDLIPFFSSAFDKNNTAKISSIMSGQFSRNGEIVEGWIKTHSISRREIILSNGEVLRDSSGSPRMQREIKDEGHSLERYSVNCKSRRVAVSSINFYDKDNQIKSPPVNADRLNYFDPTPETKGEAIASVFCIIF